MPDLFVSNKSFKQQCKYLRDMIKRKYGSDKRPKLFSGNKDVINNCLLVITDPPESNRFKSSKDLMLYKTLKENNIDNYFVIYNTYNHKKRYTRKDMKESRPFLDIAISIINPVLIVCAGELSQLTLFNNKFKVFDYHGKRIGEYDGIDVYTTYDMNYYIKKSVFEDGSHKSYIRNTDWKNIKDEYCKKVK